MELLSVVAENASAADIIKRDSDLVNSLITVGEDYKVNCQGSWKMVEWASVILFHLASRVEGTILNISDFDLDMNGSETTLHDLSVSFLMKPKWEKVGPSQLFYNDTIKNKKGDHESKCAVMDFAPTFASTPKKRISTTRGTELSKELKDRTQQKNDNISKEPCENNSASRLKKTLSTRTRLLQMVNNSCVSVCKTMGTIFCREPADTQSRRLLKQKFNIDEGNVIKFTEYLKQKISHTDKKTSSNLSSQKNAKKKLKLVIKQKFLKNIVRKLKTGMHFYGCNFKKIAQEMWLHEEEMTPKVLYNIYRKYILK
ncbi:uncharacterized protein LOC125240799 isoform X2 [Leguminivora glycinivorella]|nr:uncharacterized protein LOC125240799 isoform X2 [Leguminivora glycinivorella]